VCAAAPDMNPWDMLSPMVKSFMRSPAKVASCPESSIEWAPHRVNRGCRPGSDLACGVFPLRDAVERAPSSPAPARTGPPYLRTQYSLRPISWKSSMLSNPEAKGKKYNPDELYRRWVRMCARAVRDRKEKA
jgi:hypothetical protein